MGISAGGFWTPPVGGTAGGSDDVVHGQADVVADAVLHGPDLEDVLGHVHTLFGQIFDDLGVHLVRGDAGPVERHALLLDG